MSTEIVVCNIYKLFKSGNSFTKEGMKLKRSDIAITKAWVEECNLNWKDNGLWHVIDEEKTAEYNELREKERLLRIKQAKISKKVAENLTNMLDIGTDDIEVEKPKKKEIKEVKEIKDIDVDAEEVKSEKKIITGLGNLKVAYLEKYGKHVPVNKKNDIDWISQKVNNE